MNRSQVVDLLTYAAACDQRTVGEADILVWFDMLAPLDFEACLTAARQHYRRNPDVRLKPGHLWQACAKRTDSEAAAGLTRTCTCRGAGACPVSEHGVICGSCKGVHRSDEPCTVLRPAPAPIPIEGVFRAVEELADGDERVEHDPDDEDAQDDDTPQAGAA